MNLEYIPTACRCAKLDPAFPWLFHEQHNTQCFCIASRKHSFEEAFLQGMHTAVNPVMVQLFSKDMNSQGVTTRESCDNLWNIEDTFESWFDRLQKRRVKSEPTETNQDHPKPTGTQPAELLSHRLGTAENCKRHFVKCELGNVDCAMSTGR